MIQYLSGKQTIGLYLISGKLRGKCNHIISAIAFSGSVEKNMNTGLGKKLLILVMILSLVVIFCSPVNKLSVFTQNTLLFSLPVSSGQTLRTGYIHSVQLTPVEDDYRILDSKLWLWEERVVSHNAGLPVAAPRNGSFSSDRKWMYVRGGRYSWQTLNLRVGNSELGQNWMSLSPFGRMDLYSSWPGHLLRFQVIREPLINVLFEEETSLLLENK